MCLVDLVHLVAGCDAVAGARHDDGLLVVECPGEVVGLGEVFHCFVVITLHTHTVSSLHVLVDDILAYCGEREGRERKGTERKGGEGR